jgi:hypothetical protein
MKIDLTFVRWSVWTLLVVTAVAAYPLIRYASSDILMAVLFGAALSIVNALMGFLALEYAFDKSYSTFLKFVLGGMGVRLLFLLGVMLVLILLVQVHSVALTVSTIAMYMVFLILEIIYLQHKVVVSKQG